MNIFTRKTFSTGTPLESQWNVSGGDEWNH